MGPCWLCVASMNVIADISTVQGRKLRAVTPTLCIMFHFIALVQPICATQVAVDGLAAARAKHCPRVTS
jgi:hypothetical protein